MTEQKFESWALVELFGHQRIVGRVTEQSVGGCSFVRVDVLKEDGSFYTRLLGNGAIYAINPMGEDEARVLAKSLAQKPVYAWEVESEMRRMLPVSESAPAPASDMVLRGPTPSTDLVAAQPDTLICPEGICMRDAGHDGEHEPDLGIPF